MWKEMPGESLLILATLAEVLNMRVKKSSYMFNPVKLSDDNSPSYHVIATVQVTLWEPLCRTSELTET
jgi:hypothetical protein